MTNQIKRFIIVDDDPQNNFLAKMILKKSLGEVEIKDFLVPEEALEFIRTEFGHQTNNEITTIFLDINMPTLTGWEFLIEFNAFTVEIKNQIKIYMISSTVDPGDIERAKLNPLIIDFMEKPLNKALLTKMFG